MNLQDPRGIRVDGPTRDLLTRVSEAAQELEPLRPFSPEVQARLRATLLPDRIVATLNMEGIVATRRQTLDVMDAMRLKESVGRGQLEIHNALRADEFVCDAVDTGLLLSEGLIREINRLLLDGVKAEAGVFRPRDVELPGAPFAPPPHHAVPALIARLCELYPSSDACHPVLQAAWLHAQCTLIHPFVDGNGRAGRLLQDFVLIRRGLLPVGIPPSQRDDYYAALADADRGDWSEIVEMLALLQLTALSKTIAIAREPERRAAWIKTLSEAAASRMTNTRHKQYLVWRQRMEGVQRAFAVAVRELDESSSVLGAEIREFGLPEFAEWRKTCEQGYTDRNWLFSIVFFADGKPFYKSIACLQRHQSRPPGDPIVGERDLVGLYFTGVPAHSSDKPEYRNYRDPHIRLRELVFFKDHVYEYTQDSPDASWKCAEVLDVDGMVQGYIEDVFVRKAGLGA